MKLKARILLFDKVNISGDMFPKDCKLSIPDKVPLLWNFEQGKPACGIAEVTRDEFGLIAIAETIDTQYINEDSLKLYLTLVQSELADITTKLNIINLMETPF